MATLKRGGRYPWEMRVTALLAFGSGLVGLDRFIINPLFPVLAKDLYLDYRDLGLISAALSLSWGASAIFTGPLSDRFGRKKILVPAVLAFSLLVATSGLATGLVSLILIRIMMGFAEGAFLPASISSVTEASSPKRVGLNNGLLSMASPLVGLGFGPTIALSLLRVLPSWHWVFGVVAIPGLVTTFLIWKFLPDRLDGPDRAAAPGRARAGEAALDGEPRASVWRHRGIYVNALCMICWLICQVVLSAFMPSYLTDHLGFDLATMGVCLTGLGLGSVSGMILLPAIADRVGLKRVMTVAVALAIPVIAAFPHAHGTAALFWSLAFLMFVFGGATVITIGPLTSTLVPRNLVGAASGVVVGTGEIVGGAVAPAIAGMLAKQFGIAVIADIVLYTTVFALVLIVVCVRSRAVGPVGVPTPATASR